MSFLEAVKTGDSDKVKLLLNNPAADNNDAIRLASRYGHLEVVRLLLLDKRVDPAALSNDAIRIASQNGHLEVVRLLLADPRVDPAALNNGSILLASKYGYSDVVRLLLSNNRVNPAALDNYAIQCASDLGYAEVVRLLLADLRVNPSANDNYAIKLASINNHMEVVKLLLTDPRVDWRYARNKDQMVKNEETLLKTELTTSYLSLERSSPQTTLGRKKSAIPKEVLRQTAYLGPYQELCEAVKNSEIPPIKLVALSKILNIEYDNKIEWSKLCDKVKQAIFVSLYLHD